MPGSVSGAGYTAVTKMHHDPALTEMTWAMWTMKKLA